MELLTNKGYIMNRMLIYYCYSWYRTIRQTNVLTRTDVSLAELTSEPTERADRRANRASRQASQPSEPTGERVPGNHW